MLSGTSRSCSRTMVVSFACITNVSCHLCGKLVDWLLHCSSCLSGGMQICETVKHTNLASTHVEHYDQRQIDVLQSPVHGLLVLYQSGEKTQGGCRCLSSPSGSTKVCSPALLVFPILLLSDHYGKEGVETQFLRLGAEQWAVIRL